MAPEHGTSGAAISGGKGTPLLGQAVGHLRDPLGPWRQLGSLPNGGIRQQLKDQGRQPPGLERGVPANGRRHKATPAGGQAAALVRRGAVATNESTVRTASGAREAWQPQQPTIEIGLRRAQATGWEVPQVAYLRSEKHTQADKAQGVSAHSRLRTSNGGASGAGRTAAPRGRFSRGARAASFSRVTPLTMRPAHSRAHQAEVRWR